MRLPQRIRSLVGQPVLPLVGAGLAADAGLPDASELANALRAEAGLAEGAGDLRVVCEALEDRDGERATQVLVRQVLGRYEAQPTPTLAALAGWPGRVILTTNYDDAIERSVEVAGLKPLSLDLRTAGGRLPGEEQVAVVHLHGTLAGEGPLILPGRSTRALTGDSVFQAMATHYMADRTVIYLGFRLARSEVHLHALLNFLSGSLRGAAPHLLPLNEFDAKLRDSEFEELVASGQLEVIPLAARSREFAHQIVRLLAPRAEPVSNQVTERVGPVPKAFVAPQLIQAPIETDSEELDRLAFAGDYEMGEPLANVDQLTNTPRALLLASPGMGKSGLLTWLTRQTVTPPAVWISAKEVAAKLSQSEPGQLAVARALAGARAGRDGVPVPTRQALEENGFLILVDDLDEVEQDARGQTARALVAAADQWPQHRWVVASRPVAETLSIEAEDFAVFRIWPSRTWAEQYMRRRGVDPAAVIKLRESGGFDELITIPLFAAGAADRLAAGTPIERPLDLLVDLPREGAEREARKHALAGDELFAWLVRLALGLELRGRNQATVAELAGVSGEAELAIELWRTRLIERSLLAELPRLAAFPRKTMQEALCAHALLGATDLAAAVGQLLSADVDGQRELRSDIDFTLDLVWENASPPQRAVLKEVDLLRWARTAITTADEITAGEALDVLLEFHRRLSIPLLSWGENLIRSERAAVAQLSQRFPAIVSARRASLLKQVASEPVCERRNAAAVLASMGPDQDTGWLERLLTDTDGHVRSAAVSIIRRWAEPRFAHLLRPLIDEAAPGSGVGQEALIALAELSSDDQQELLAVAEVAEKYPRAARYLRERLVEQLDREHLLILMGHKRRGAPDDMWIHALAGVLRSYNDSEPSDKEFQDLVKALIHGGVSVSDLTRLPALGPTMSLNATLVMPVLREQAQRHRQHGAILLLFSLMPELDRSAEAGGALDVYLKELATDPSRVQPPNPTTDWGVELRARLASRQINEAHPFVSHTWPHDLEEPYRERLRELAEAWWPDQALVEVARSNEGDQYDRAVAAISAAAAGGLPLSRERWLDLVAEGELLESAGSWRWALAQYRPEYEMDLIELVDAATDGRQLARLLAAVPSKQVGEPLAEAIIGRLGTTGDSRGWGTVIGMLAERGFDHLLRELETERLGEQQRRLLDGELAESGAAQAQRRVLTWLIGAVQAGETAPSFHWPEPVTDDGVALLLGQLIDATPETGRVSGDARSSAEAALANSCCIGAIRAYQKLAARSGGAYRVLSERAIKRRIATQSVLARLPESLPEVVEQAQRY